MLRDWLQTPDLYAEEHVFMLACEYFQTALKGNLVSIVMDLGFVGNGFGFDKGDGLERFAIIQEGNVEGKAVKVEHSIDVWICERAGTCEAHDELEGCVLYNNVHRALQAIARDSFFGKRSLRDQAELHNVGVSGTFLCGRREKWEVGLHLCVDVVWSA